MGDDKFSAEIRASRSDGLAQQEEGAAHHDDYDIETVERVYR